MNTNYMSRAPSCVCVCVPKQHTFQKSNWKVFTFRARPSGRQRNGGEKMGRKKLKREREREDKQRGDKDMDGK